MAQTIKIKRSTVTAVPSTLAQGELAYSAESTSNKLFIGTPGTGDVIPIGGKYYTDVVDSLVVDGKIELTGDVTGTSTYNAVTKKWDIATSIAPVGITGTTGSTNFNVPDDDIAFSGLNGISVDVSKTGTDIAVQVALDSNLRSFTVTDDDLDTDSPPEIVNTRTFNIETGTLNFGGQTGISTTTTVDGNTLNVLFDLDDTAVTPGSYGSASAIPVLTVDQQGRITEVTTQSVATTLTVDDNNPATTDTLSIDLLTDTLNIWGGTGVTSTLDGSNDSITLSIGQDVGTSADVQFNNVTVGGTLYSDDLTGTDVVAGNLDTAAGNTSIRAGAGTGTGAGGDIVFYVAPPSETSGNSVNAHEAAMTISDDKSVVIEGDLTVRGTTTSVNSNEVNIGDNIIVLNSDETGAPSQHGGIEIERGTSENVALRWNETTDKWQVTTDGTNYTNLISVSNFETEITVLDGGTF